MEFCTGIASGSYRCFFSLRCLATSVCASSCGSFFLSSCFPASGCLRVLSSGSSLLLSSSLTWPVSSAPGWGSPPLVSVFPCYLRCSAWRSIGSLRLCLSAVSAFWGSLFPCSLLPVAPGFSAAYFLPPFYAVLLPPLRVSLALPLRCPGLVRILVSLQFAPGFFSGLFSSSFLRCSCCLCCGSLCFPSALASSFIDFVGSTPLPGCAQAYAPLSGTSTTPSVLLSQCMVRVLLSFGRGLWLRSIPVLWLRFLRLLFLTFACLRLRWCLP